MQIKAETPVDYIAQLPDDRKLPMIKLRQTILENIPEGFVEMMSYGSIGYLVPHSLYPDGYQTNSKLPLPFINIASQKNYISLHHLGISCNTELLEWFINEYPKYCTTKLDMGKGCIRFKKMDQIPYKLIAELVSKMTVEVWIKNYEAAYKR